MSFGCSKVPSHRDGSFEYPQHMFWLRNKKNNFRWGPAYSFILIVFVCVCVCLSTWVSSSGCHGFVCSLSYSLVHVSWLFKLNSVVIHGLVRFSFIHTYKVDISTEIKIVGHISLWPVDMFDHMLYVLFRQEITTGFDCPDKQK